LRCNPWIFNGLWHILVSLRWIGLDVPHKILTSKVVWFLYICSAPDYGAISLRPNSV
jgi:hypothetical protein